MIKHVYGDILEVDAELLVNASNAKGYMGGLVGRFFRLKGVAESIHYVDPSIEKNAKRKFKKTTIRCGGVLHTSSGSLPFSKGILHAVTMKSPGQKSNIETVKKCIENILIYSEENNVKSIALPLLGTGTGRVRKEEVLHLYQSMLRDSDSLFKIVHLSSNDKVV